MPTKWSINTIFRVEKMISHAESTWRLSELVERISRLLTWVLQSDAPDKVQSWIAEIIYHLYKQNNIINRLEFTKEALRILAYYSQLTGLPNRIGLANELTLSFDEKSTNTIVAFDIDFLKKYNTEHDHDWGDIAIVHLGEMVKEIVWEFQIRYPNIMIYPAHLSGDEFVVIIAGWAEYGQYIAERLHHKLATTPVSIQDTWYNVSVTCWIATSDHAREYSPLIKQKWLGTDIPMWTAQIMKLADQAVTIAERWWTHVYDGTTIEMDLTAEQKKWIESLSDMLRWIHTQAILARVLLEMIQKIAEFQNKWEHIVAIDSILRAMKNKKELTESEIRFIDNMLADTEKFSDFLDDLDNHTVHS